MPRVGMVTQETGCRSTCQTSTAEGARDGCGGTREAARLAGSDVVVVELLLDADDARLGGGRQLSLGIDHHLQARPREGRSQREISSGGHAVAGGVDREETERETDSEAAKAVARGPP